MPRSLSVARAPESDVIRPSRSTELCDTRASTFDNRPALLRT